jgi:hypothetical protein
MPLGTRRPVADAPEYQHRTTVKRGRPPRPNGIDALLKTRSDSTAVPTPSPSPYAVSGDVASPTVPARSARCAIASVRDRHVGTVLSGIVSKPKCSMCERSSRTPPFKLSI